MIPEENPMTQNEPHFERIDTRATTMPRLVPPPTIGSIGQAQAEQILKGITEPKHPIEAMMELLYTLPVEKQMPALKKMQERLLIRRQLLAKEAEEKARVARAMVEEIEGPKCVAETRYKED